MCVSFPAFLPSPKKSYGSLLKIAKFLAPECVCHFLPTPSPKKSYVSLLKVQYFAKN